MVKEFRHARDNRLGAALAIAPKSQDRVVDWVASLFADMKPKAVVSAERLGPGLDGTIYSATALPFSGPLSTVEYPTIDISGIVTEATRRGILTIGIGDHGNEIGFGHIHAAVADAMPKGEILCTKIPTDVVLPAMMSNWGCYGIEAALAFLLKRPELVHSPAQEAKIIRACLDAGGLESIFTNTEFVVDGLDGETSMACMQFLSNIVRKSLESGTTGLAH
jgi:D-glutamate cyclase